MQKNWKFPTKGPLAKIYYLAIQATSAPNDQIFSVVGSRLISNFHTNLDP
jgi:hypothetical protein